MRGLRTALFCSLLVVALAGCVSLRRGTPKPGRTRFHATTVVLPATRLGDYLVIEAKGDRMGPCHFLIDTGSSVTLISPDFAKRFANFQSAPNGTPQVRVKSSDGHAAMLASTSVRVLEFGDVRFDDVSALVYDCSALSAHLGVKIDGILGFPLFRDALLTLDYPGSRVVLNPSGYDTQRQGTPIAFNNQMNTPVISIRLGDTRFDALIDSGSDAALSLNPVGMRPAFAVEPRPAGIVSSLTGDRTQSLGRIDGTLSIGDSKLQNPIVEITDELSSIGGGILRDFAVTFDQERSQATFYRAGADAIVSGPKRSAGLSFNKAPKYWSVIGVIASSPAASTTVRTGDLVTKINGEPVAQWNLRRYDDLIAAAPEITLTLLNGTRETNVAVRVFDLVP